MAKVKEIKTDHDVSRMCEYIMRGVTMAAATKLKQVMEFIATTMLEQERQAVLAEREAIIEMFHSRTVMCSGEEIVDKIKARTALASAASDEREKR